MIGQEAELMSPFHAFRFHVSFREQPLNSAKAANNVVPLCSGSFSECSGIEATMEPEVINEGGRNYGSAQRAGKVSFSTIVLKRGLTSNRDMWQWFELVNRGAMAYRLAAVLTVRGPEAPTRSARPPRSLSAENGQAIIWEWGLRHCLPVKFKAPDLNAIGSEVAIEELHLAHEGLTLL